MIFDGIISENTKNTLASHFENISPFEYDDEYLILHLTKDTELDDKNVLFDITDIAAIYPISKQAKASIEDKIDRRIRLEQPVFESVLPIIESNIQKKEIEKAIDALWTLCGMTEDKNDILEIIGIDNIYEGLEFRKSGTKAFKIENGNYWSILIAYERHEYFPNEISGFFFDAAQVFAYSKNQTSFEGSLLHKFLSNLDAKAKSEKILKALEESELTQSYCLQTTFNQLRGYIVAPLFLMLKSDIRENDDVYSTKLFQKTKFFQSFGKEFKAALILLGAFFGFKKFYDLYYDKANLRFYKNYSPGKMILTQSESDATSIEVKEEANKSVESALETAEFVPEKEMTQVSEEILEEKAITKSKKKIKESKEEQVTEGKKNDEIDTLKAAILDVMKKQKDVSVTNLGKELLKQFKIKKSNTILENIINEIKEIELYRDKKTTKVRNKAEILFNHLTEQG